MAPGVFTGIIIDYCSGLYPVYKGDVVFIVGYIRFLMDMSHCCVVFTPVIFSRYDT